jgi:hypothetical protein
MGISKDLARPTSSRTQGEESRAGVTSKMRASLSSNMDMYFSK